MRPASVNPAGGLRYHYRAWRFRTTLWQPFIQPLNAWLAAWAPRSPRLLLIGASGGYCLSEAFLGRFREVDAVDPDPLARHVFLRRFGDRLPGTRITWTPDDFFGPARGRFDAGRLGALFDRFPDHAVLFSNFLGQLPCLYPAAVDDPSFGWWRRALAERLRSRDWASFHDRLSGIGRLAPGLPPLTIPGPVENETLARALLSPGAGPTLELLDHQTVDLFPGFENAERHLLLWQIHPGQFHLIEGVRSGPRL